MANVYVNTDNALKGNLAKQKSITFLFAAASFFILFGLQAFSLFFRINYIFIFIGFFAVLACLIGFHNSLKKYNVYKIGLEGEEATATILSTLPEGYSVITNAEIVAEGKKSEIDFIVIGPNGLFVVENKAHKGFISGNTSDNDLVQTKDNGNNTNKFYNPIKQVATHAYRLKKLLEENGINIYVNTVVFFSNPDAEVQINNDNDCQTLCLCAAKSNLNSEIVNFSAKQISNEDIETIRTIICKNIISNINKNASDEDED